MALKRKITKAEHTALNPLIQAEYAADGEDFILNAEGFDDPGELKRAKDREVDARKIAEQKAKDLQTELDTITNTDARRAGDVKALEKSWQTKLDQANQASELKLNKLTGFIQTSLIDGNSTAIAAELAGDNSHVLLPHIRQRLSVDLTGETPLLRVLDKDGKPSAFNLEDLKKDFAADPKFKSVVVASKASGGGAAGGGAAGSRGGAPATKKFAELSDKERTDWYNTDKQGFLDASNAAKQEMIDNASKPVRAA